MEQNNNIFIKLELTKNLQTKNLTLTAHLNPQAPNIKTFEDHISWVFTEEEQELLFDAISMIRNKQQILLPVQNKKTMLSLRPDYKENDTINETIEKYAKTPQYMSNTHETIDAIIKSKNKSS